MVAATLKYRRAGVKPPVFVAGSFGHPEWVPREMDWVLDERGENLYTKEIEVDEDREYQYKFKVGHGNNWDLDEQSPTSKRFPIVTRRPWHVLIQRLAYDNAGNVNNLLSIASKESASPMKQRLAVNNGKSTRKNTASEHSEPIKPREPLTTDDNDRETTPEKVPATPLFPHESLGAYDFEVVDDGFDHSLSPSVSRGLSTSSFAALEPHPATTDVDDPTIEQFPCDKSSVMSTLRKLSTSVRETPVGLEDGPASPELVSRRASVDSNADSVPSPGSLSPTSARKRDSRLSHSSTGRTKSAVSLGSIVEEPQRAFQTNKTRRKADDVATGSASDEEGPQMKGFKVHLAQTTRETRDSQASSVALSPKSPEKMTGEPSKSVRKTAWQPDGGDMPIEARW
jgi:ATP-dependent RNA helicase MRH4